MSKIHRAYALLPLAIILTLILSVTGCGNRGQQPTQQQTVKEGASAPATGKSDGGATSAGKTDTKSKSDSPKIGGTLNVGLFKDISSMNPQIDTKSTDNAVRTLMYETLLGNNKDMKDIPQLAERWDVSTNGLEYTFYLRKDVKFHNGQPMTAKDVKWSIDYVMDPKNVAYGLPFYNKVSSVDIVDNFTIKFTLKEPEAAFLSYFNSIQAFAVVPAGSLQTGMDKPSSFPPGTGPYKFEEYKSGQHLIVSRFEGYWAKGPYVDKIVIKMPIPDDNVRFAALRAGDLDIIQNAPFQWAEKVKKGEIKGLMYAESMKGQFRRIVFNVQKPPFDNIKIRQAVANALNRQEILDTVYWGFGTPVNEKLPAGSPWEAKLPGIKQDLAKAKALLAEAGYPGGITVKLMSRQGNEEEAQIIQKQMGDVGIKVEIEILESATYTGRQRSGDFQFMVYGGNIATDPSVTYTPDLKTESGDKRGSNVAGYKDPEMDRLLREMGTTVDFDKRKEIYRQVIVKFWNDIPEIYIGLLPGIWAYNEKVKGFVPDPLNNLGIFEGALNHVWIDK